MSVDAVSVGIVSGERSERYIGTTTLFVWGLNVLVSEKYGRFQPTTCFEQDLLSGAMSQRTTERRESRRHDQRARLQWVMLVLVATFAIAAAFIFFESSGGTGHYGS